MNNLRSEAALLAFKILVEADTSRTYLSRLATLDDFGHRSYSVLGALCEAYRRENPGKFDWTYTRDDGRDVAVFSRIGPCEDKQQITYLYYPPEEVFLWASKS